MHLYNDSNFGEISLCPLNVTGFGPAVGDSLTAICSRPFYGIQENNTSHCQRAEEYMDNNLRGEYFDS